MMSSDSLSLFLLDAACSLCLSTLLILESKASDAFRMTSKNSTDLFTLNFPYSSLMVSRPSYDKIVIVSESTVPDPASMTS